MSPSALDLLSSTSLQPLNGFRLSVPSVLLSDKATAKKVMTVDVGLLVRSIVLVVEKDSPCFVSKQHISPVI